MRKRIVPSAFQEDVDSTQNWLDLDYLAQVEITSEEPPFPIESALLAEDGPGWRASHSGEQTIRLRFDRPQRIRRIRLEFTEQSVERTQQFILRWTAEGESSRREIVRQQWNFNPQTATSQVEDYQVDLTNVILFELTILPDISGGPARASLARLRLA